MAHAHEPATERARGRAGARDRRALALALVVTAVFAVVEAVGGVVSGSLALLSDAGHMVTDVSALALALFAAWLASRPAPAHRTFGYYRAETLAALENGVLLVVIAGLIVFEAWERWVDPAPVNAPLMAAVAAVGLAVNVLAFRILTRGHAHGHARDDASGPGASLNVRAASLHVIGDMLGSVGALLAAGVILATGNVRVDAFVSVLVAALILVAAHRLLRETLHVLMLGTPEGIAPLDVVDALTDVPGIAHVDDVHFWTVTSGYNVLTAHLVLEPGADPVRTTARAKEVAHARFPVAHTTFEVEEEPCPPGLPCGPDERADPRPGRSGAQDA